jgi:hypothetical protein
LPVVTLLSSSGASLGWSRRELDGITHQVRLERLSARLAASGPLAVAHNTWGMFGDRIRLFLDDGSLMVLKLFWPRPVAAAALTSVRFDRRTGWVVTARAASGDRLIYVAWLARLFPDGVRRHW